MTPIFSGYLVSVPDLDINTQGLDIADAIGMAREAIGIWGITEEDYSRTISEPTTLTPQHNKDESVFIEEVDFSIYRSRFNLLSNGLKI